MATGTESANKGLFEVISDDSVRIRGRAFKVHHQAEPFEDGTTHTLEATTDSRNKYGQFLEVHELREISAAMLPVGFSIMIERPKSQFKDTTLAYFKNVRAGHQISQGIYFDYADWHLPINVMDFADLLKAELTEGQARLSKVHIDKADASLYMTCMLNIDTDDDLYARFKDLDASITRAYRRCIQSLATPHQQVEHKSDSSGLKWWVRYVVVPLAGSGAFAALIAWLIAKGFFA